MKELWKNRRKREKEKSTVDNLVKTQYKGEIRKKDRRDPRGILGKMSVERRRTEIGKNSTETAEWDGEVAEGPWECEDEPRRETEARRIPIPEALLDLFCGHDSTTLDKAEADSRSSDANLEKNVLTGTIVQ